MVSRGTPVHAQESGRELRIGLLADWQAGRAAAVVECEEELTGPVTAVMTEQYPQSLHGHDRSDLRAGYWFFLGAAGASMISSASITVVEPGPVSCC